MNALLDTNICIYLIENKPIEVLDRFDEYAVGDIAVSSITVAELYFGVSKSQRVVQNRQALEQFLLPLEITHFGPESAIAYGDIRTELESQGTPIGPLDTLIAAQAIGLDLTLVTNNTREFERVPGLKLENWIDV